MPKAKGKKDPYQTEDVLFVIRNRTTPKTCHVLVKEADLTYEIDPKLDLHNQFLEIEAHIVERFKTTMRMQFYKLMHLS